VQAQIEVRGKPLSPFDLQQLARCGISPETAERALLRRVDSLTGSEIVGRNGTGDYSGILFPYIWPGENHVRDYRLRRDHPEMEQGEDGRLKPKGKYLSPPGRGNMLYLPPGTRPEWLEDASLPIVITEGEKKCLALSDLAWYGLTDTAERPRWLSIAIAGVSNWQGTIGMTNAPDGSRVPVKGPISDFARINLNRAVTIVFEQYSHEQERLLGADSSREMPPG
jgi:Domain of unknown function (DUF3854)